MAKAFTLAAILALALVIAVLTVGKLAPGALEDERVPAAMPTAPVRSVPVVLEQSDPVREAQRPARSIPAVVRKQPARRPVRPTPPAPAAPRAVAIAPPRVRRGHTHSHPASPQQVAQVPAPQTPAAPADPAPSEPVTEPPAAVKVELPPALPQLVAPVIGAELEAEPTSVEP